MARLVHYGHLAGGAAGTEFGASRDGVQRMLWFAEARGLIALVETGSSPISGETLYSGRRRSMPSRHAAAKSKYWIARVDADRTALWHLDRHEASLLMTPAWEISIAQTQLPESRRWIWQHVSGNPRGKEFLGPDRGRGLPEPFRCAASTVAHHAARGRAVPHGHWKTITFVHALAAMVVDGCDDRRPLLGFSPAMPRTDTERDCHCREWNDQSLHKARWRERQLKLHDGDRRVRYLHQVFARP